MSNETSSYMIPGHNSPSHQPSSIHFFHSEDAEDDQGILDMNIGDYWFHLSNAKIATNTNNTKLLLDLMSRSGWDSDSSYCRSKEST